MILRSLVELDGIGETQVDAIENFFSKQINTKHPSSIDEKT